MELSSAERELDSFIERLAACLRARAAEYDERAEKLSEGEADAEQTQPPAA